MAPCPGPSPRLYSSVATVTVEMGYSSNCTAAHSHGSVLQYASARAVGFLPGQHTLSTPDGSVAGELSQLGVTRVELPELRTQLNSMERVATESTTVVTAFGSPLPYLVRSHTKPNNSVSQRCRVVHFDNTIQHQDPINTSFPRSFVCLTCAIFGFEECLTG